ncbi:hypothetical protein MBANPS3_008848 [Mucor bainieri]
MQIKFVCCLVLAAVLAGYTHALPVSDFTRRAGAGVLSATDLTGAVVQALSSDGISSAVSQSIGSTVNTLPDYFTIATLLKRLYKN